MKVDRKHVIVLLMFGFVFGLALYFYFSPGNEGVLTDSPEFTEFSGKVEEFNVDFTRYTNSYADLVESGNEMIKDNVVEIEELETYEEDVEKFIGNVESLFNSIGELRDMISKESGYFENSEDEIKNLNYRERLVKDDLGNIVVFINMLRGTVKEETHDKILNDLSVELINLRDD